MNKLLCYSFMLFTFLTLMTMTMVCYGRELPYFYQIEGEIVSTEVRDFTSGETLGETFFVSVSVDNKDLNNQEEDAQSDQWAINGADQQNIVNLIVGPETYFADPIALTQGEKIVAFYRADAPAIMIYPPQYNCSIIAAPPEDYFIKADHFNQELISNDNTLRLNLGDDTKVLNQNNSTEDGAIGDNLLLVFYTTSTRSIPALTTPHKVVVLKNNLSTSLEGLPETPQPELSNNETNGQLSELLNSSEKIEHNGVVMVPLRRIAEGLGYDVTWEGETQSVLISNGVLLQIGNTLYMIGHRSVYLNTEPILKNDTTYVPINFFDEKEFENM